MKNYIDKDELLKKANLIASQLSYEEIDGALEVIFEIETTKTENVRENKFGRWLQPLPNMVKTCSICGLSIEKKYNYPFCPGCAADMREEKSTHEVLYGNI